MQAIYSFEIMMPEIIAFVTEEALDVIDARHISTITGQDIVAAAHRLGLGIHADYMNECLAVLSKYEKRKNKE